MRVWCVRVRVCERVHVHACGAHACVPARMHAFTCEDPNASDREFQG